MSLTAQQLQTLKNDIVADPVLNAQPRNGDGDFAIAEAYNLTASPAFTVWKTSVPIDQVGMNFNGTELAGLTTANTSRLQVIGIFLDVVNPTLANNRQFFDDVFSGAGGVNTRAALLILWKRLATRAEKLFANTSGGNGADATPATLVFEGQILPSDVNAARNLP